MILENSANFITAPFVFPELASGTGWGGPHQARGDLAFFRRRPTILRVGL